MDSDGVLAELGLQHFVGESLMVFSSLREAWQRTSPGVLVVPTDLYRFSRGLVVSAGLCHGC